jgi:hypothetical protein
MGFTCSDYLHPGSRTNRPTVTLPRCTMSAFPLSTNCRVSSWDSRLLPFRVADCSIPLTIPFTILAGQRLQTGMMPPSQARYIPYQMLASRESRVRCCPVASASLLLPTSSLQLAGQRLRSAPVEQLLYASSINKRGEFRQRRRNPLYNPTFPVLDYLVCHEAVGLPMYSFCRFFAWCLGQASRGGMERRCRSCYYPGIT